MLEVGKSLIIINESKTKILKKEKNNRKSEMSVTLSKVVKKYINKNYKFYIVHNKHINSNKFSNKFHSQRHVKER